MLDTPHGTAATTIRFSVNGEPVAVSVDPFASLASTLRDRLGLTGTKIGCDAGDCGACTVLIDGRQACACLIATAQAEGADIHTVEGPGPGGLTDRLRRAFLTHGAAQCGICTPGMLMAAVDCLSCTPAPSRAEVEDALGGVLCRCTGYIKIVEAVMAVAGGVRPCGSDPRAQRRSEHGVRPAGSDPFVGARLARVDGWAKVTGTDTFGADAAPDGALHMRVVRSPHARATFTLGDLDGVVARTPGLAAILTHRDVPGENSFGIFAHTRDQPVLAEGHVRFRGEAVVALVGTREAVESLSDADLPIAWAVEPPVIGVEAARAPGAPAVHAGRPDNVLAQGFLTCGDVEAARPSAAAVAEGRLETAFVEHAYIEPEAGYAVPCGERMEVTCCTQAPYMDREETARVLGVEPARVRIRPTACGGGFGGKLDVSVQPLLAVAARVTGKPVRIVYTRTEFDGLDHQAPPRQAVGARVGRPGGAARLLRAGGRLQHRRLRLLGTDRGRPRACARHGAVQGSQRPQPSPAPSTPTRPRPAPSAASACPRRPSRTRPCSTISPSSSASTAGTSAASTPSATATRRPPASASTIRRGCPNALTP